MRYYFEEVDHDSYTGFSTMQDGKKMQYQEVADGRTHLMDNETGEVYPIVYTLPIPDTDLFLFVTEV